MKLCFMQLSGPLVDRLFGQTNCTALYAPDVPMFDHYTACTALFDQYSGAYNRQINSQHCVNYTSLQMILGHYCHCLGQSDRRA